MLASNYYLPQDKVFFLYKGRVALYALLHEMGIGEGDQVLMPAYTCVVVPNAVLYLGAEPLYTDIELPSFSVTPASVENAVTERTKVVLCQNTYGLSAHVDEIVDLCRKGNPDHRGLYPRLRRYL